MGRKFLLSLTVLKKTCACGTLSSLDGEVSGRACSYKYGPVLDLNGASRCWKVAGKLQEGCSNDVLCNLVGDCNKVNK
ncbi:hypothetical protein PF008_g16715 [Phytophthora fragariae]|uniref:Uncharacterized protein n=1 Tax=Phytophthora fragariae TaxID=53985 RepID=A0A6G0RBP8_9STRA|nr:hypothetical protein PF008_g16715 [Phytophthora fragariae]